MDHKCIRCHKITAPENIGYFKTGLMKATCEPCLKIQRETQNQKRINAPEKQKYCGFCHKYQPIDNFKNKKCTKTCITCLAKLKGYRNDWSDDKIVMFKMRANVNNDLNQGRQIAIPMNYQHVEFLLNFYEKKCVYCCCNVKFRDHNDYDQSQYSLDRIDTTLGHSFDNVVLSCLGCNLKRKQNSVLGFIELNQHIQHTDL